MQIPCALDGSLAVQDLRQLPQPSILTKSETLRGEMNRSKQHDQKNQSETPGTPPLVVLQQLLDPTGNALLRVLQLLQQLQPLLLQIALVLRQTLLQPLLLLPRAGKPGEGGGFGEGSGCPGRALPSTPTSLTVCRISSLWLLSCCTSRACSRCPTFRRRSNSSFSCIFLS